MFTGLVQVLATVARSDPDTDGGRELAIAGANFVPQLGESIAVNGVCLTVVDSAGVPGTSAPEGNLRFQVGPETLVRTNLGDLQPGDRVNLERALRVGDPIGGHFVSGHVDAVGRIAQRIHGGDWQTIWFEYPPEFDELMVSKGSIAIDGISLTLVDVEPGRFSVMLIPHTLAVTTLGFKPVGGTVNLEFDLLAKHVRKLVRGRE